MKSDARKFIFVHIPKCGGTSIERILFPREERTEENFWMGFVGISALPGLRRLPRRVMRPVMKMNRYQTDALQHLTALQMRHAMGRDRFYDYYRFAIVRHPTKRILSQYKYMQKRADLRSWIGMKRDDSFLEYLKKTYRRHHVHWQDQVSFLYDHRGECLVNDIVKLEEIDSGMNVVFDRLGMERIEIPHVNKSKDAPAKRPTLSENEKDIIWELFKDDFEVLGYDID